MSRLNHITLGLVLASLATTDAAAQWNVSRYGTARKHVYTTFGLDPAIITSAGLSSVGTLVQHDFQLTAEAGIVTAHADAGDFRTRLGLQTSLARWRSLQLTGSAMAVVRGTDNSVYRGINFGADVSGTLGVYRPRWFAAGEVGKDKAIITHVKHTDWYRQNFYADAKDGWYLDAGGTLRHGIAAGLTVGRVELMTRMGWLKTEDYNRVMTPGYASIGVGFGY